MLEQVNIRFVSNDDHIFMGKLEIVNGAGVNITGSNTGMFNLSGSFSTRELDCSVGQDMNTHDLVDPAISNTDGSEVLIREKIGKELLTTPDQILTVTTRGKIKKYQWYKSSSTNGSWRMVYYTGYRTNQLTVPVESYMNNASFYCEVTDYEGNIYNSNAAKIIINE